MFSSSTPHLFSKPLFLFLQHLMVENCSKDLGRTYAKLCGLCMHLISQALGDVYLKKNCRFGYLKRRYTVNSMKQIVVLQFGNRCSRSRNNMGPQKWKIRPERFLWKKLMLLPFTFLGMCKSPKFYCDFYCHKYPILNCCPVSHSPCCCFKVILSLVLSEIHKLKISKWTFNPEF